MAGAAARGLLGALLLAALTMGAGCDQAMEMTTTTDDDQDRQCAPESGCKGNLICSNLMPVKMFSDGGVAQNAYFVCRKGCSADTECPKDYVCFRAQTPAQLVCVPRMVADTLRKDGGT